MQKLCTFLKTAGGIKDDSGELAAIDLRLSRPGLVNNKSGMTLEDATQLAVDNGYILDIGLMWEGCSDVDYRDLIEAIETEIAGFPRYPGGYYVEQQKASFPPPVSREQSLYAHYRKTKNHDLRISQ